MPQHKEKDLREKVRQKILLRYGAGVWYYHPSDRYRKGVPDILMCFFGQFVAIELKKDKSIGPTKLQQHNILEINNAGGYAFWSDNISEIMSKLTVIKPLMN